MDPLSLAASIGSLAGFSIRLLTTLSEFVDAVREAPKEVQCLSNELASLYAALGHVKIALQTPRVSTIPPAWIADFDKLVADCHDTLADVQGILDKARATQTAGSATQLWKVVKFSFKSKQVDLLRKRIAAQTAILSNLLAALTESRTGHIESRLEDIHGKVEELVLSRRNVKEVLVVLDKEENEGQLADFVLKDRTSRHTRADLVPEAESAPPLGGGQALAPAEPDPGAISLTETVDTIPQLTPDVPDSPYALTQVHGSGSQHEHEDYSPVSQDLLGVGVSEPVNEAVQVTTSPPKGVTEALASSLRDALEPTSEDRAILSMISRRKWTIMAAGYRGSETSERWISLHQRRSDKDRKPPYILTLSLGRLVILTFSQIYPATGTSPMRWYYSGGASQVKIEVVGSQIQALSSRTSWAPNDMFYTLETPEEARTLAHTLRHLYSLCWSTWTLHTFAFSKVTPDIDVASEEKLNESTDREIARYWRSIYYYA